MSNTKSDDEVVAGVIAAEEARLAAVHGRDWSKLDACLGEDLTYTHMSGLFQNKAENMEDMRTKPRTYERHNLVVRPYDDMAVMNGLLDVKMHPLADGTPGRELHGRVVQVWAYRDGRWQMIVFQATAVPQGEE